MIVQPTGPPVDENLMGLSLLADAGKVAGFARLLTTNRVAFPSDRGIEVVSVAPLLERAVMNVCGEARKEHQFAGTKGLLQEEKR